MPLIDGGDDYLRTPIGAAPNDDALEADDGNGE